MQPHFEESMDQKTCIIDVIRKKQAVLNTLIEQREANDEELQVIKHGGKIIMIDGSNK